MEKYFRVAIVGGRDFSDFNRMVRVCDKLLRNKIAEGYKIIVINGKARGADSLGGEYAKLRGFGCEEAPADWDRFGKSAGYRRNEEMAKSSDAVIAFWDNSSKGTKHMIDISMRLGKQIRIYEY